MKLVDPLRTYEIGKTMDLHSEMNILPLPYYSYLYHVLFLDFLSPLPHENENNLKHPILGTYNE